MNTQTLAERTEEQETQLEVVKLEEQSRTIREYSVRCPIFSRVGRLEENIEKYIANHSRGERVCAGSTASLDALVHSLIEPSNADEVLLVQRKGCGEVTLLIDGTSKEFYHAESYLKQSGYKITSTREVNHTILSFTTDKLAQSQYKHEYLQTLCNTKKVECSSVRDDFWGYLSGIISGEIRPVLQIYNFLLHNGLGMKMREINLQFDNHEGAK